MASNKLDALPVGEGGPDHHNLTTVDRWGSRVYAPLEIGEGGVEAKGGQYDGRGGVDFMTDGQATTVAVRQSRLYGAGNWGGGVKWRGLKVTRPPGHRTIRVTTSGHPIDVRRAFA